MPEAVIVAATRSPIGRAFKGSMTELRADDLTATIVEAAMAKVPQLRPDAIDDLHLGCGLPGGEQGFNMARVVTTLLGWTDVPGTTITRYCASSLQTTRMAFHAIKAGEGDAFVSAGVEMVSRFRKPADAKAVLRDFADGLLLEPDEIERSFARGERSQAPSGLPYRFIIKSTLPIGMALIAVALVWWITFFTKVGGIGDAWACLIWVTPYCATVMGQAQAQGLLAYYPFVMWLGIALWLTGLFLMRRIDIASLAYAAVGIPLLWAVWITIEQALVLFE